jgi:MFS family permease
MNVEANEIDNLLEKNISSNMEINNNNTLKELINKENNIVDKYIDSSLDNRIIQFILCLALSNAADAVEIVCIGFIMTELGDTVTQYEKEFLTAAVFMGMLLGGLLCGYLSDIIGRKPCLLYSLGINTIAGFCSAFAPNIDILIGLRIISGIGIGGSVPVVFSLGAEIFPSFTRGKYLSIVAAFFMVGALYASITAWIMLGKTLNGSYIMPGVTWRGYAIVSGIPALIAFIVSFYYLPESPRYLMDRGKKIEAIKALEYMTGESINNITINNINCNDEENNKKDSIKDNIINNRNISTLSILGGPKLRNTTINLILIWFTLSFGSYGLLTWISNIYKDVGLSNPFADSFIFSLANLPGNLISIVFVEKYGRRNLLCWGMCLAALCSVLFAFNYTNSIYVVIFSSLFNAFSTAGWNSLDCLSVESFPTVVRTSAMGLLAASGRVGSISAQFVFGSLENNITLLLAITSLCMFFGGMSSLLLPNDNTGRSLSKVDEFNDDNISEILYNPINVK